MAEFVPEKNTTPLFLTLRLCRQNIYEVQFSEAKDMNYVETKRFRCSNAEGRNYTVIEQMRTSRRSVNTRTDYVTEEGDVAERLDDGSFLLLLSNEVIRVS
ncbi:MULTISPECIES: hypothetical protein [unclassified Rhizobium]|jgi:hypothetical protein|uniref:hypothetical protein n=1 Tax=unclassified Rhizobium TaxID=2613769 RepID=UPI000A97A168|nr:MULTISPECIES: hypothetical protein [Rhizobium]UFW78784.1 hypothetical protein RlegSU303_02315 [Rhizobium leguminosarum bv. viciae]